METQAYCLDTQVLATHLALEDSCIRQTPKPQLLRGKMLDLSEPAAQNEGETCKDLQVKPQPSREAEAGHTIQLKPQPSSEAEAAQTIQLKPQPSTDAEAQLNSAASQPSNIPNTPPSPKKPLFEPLSPEQEACVLLPRMCEAVVYINMLAGMYT